MMPAAPIKSRKIRRGSSVEQTKHPVDRPGFDLGGATGKTTAGFGLGLGEDSSDSRQERSLPGRRMTGRLSIPHWVSPDILKEPKPKPPKPE